MGFNILFEGYDQVQYCNLMYCFTKIYIICSVVPGIQSGLFKGCNNEYFVDKTLRCANHESEMIKDILQSANFSSQLNSSIIYVKGDVCSCFHDRCNNVPVDNISTYHNVYISQIRAAVEMNIKAENQNTPGILITSNTDYVTVNFEVSGHDDPVSVMTKQQANTGSGKCITITASLINPAMLIMMQILIQQYMYY